MHPIYSCHIITDIRLLEDGEPYEVERKWKERLFTFPWRPLKKTKMVVPKVPSKKAYGFDDKIVMHPATLAALRHEADAR